MTALPTYSEPTWFPQPPMALGWQWTEWRNPALDRIEHQREPWTADDMRATLPTGRSNWYGAAVRTATSRKMIHLVGQRRSTHPSRKGSLLAVWETKQPAL